MGHSTSVPGHVIELSVDAAGLPRFGQNLYAEVHSDFSGFLKLPVWGQTQLVGLYEDDVIVIAIYTADSEADFDSGIREQFAELCLPWGLIKESMDGKAHTKVVLAIDPAKPWLGHKAGEFEYVEAFKYARDSALSDRTLHRASVRVHSRLVDTSILVGKTAAQLHEILPTLGIVWTARDGWTTPSFGVSNDPLEASKLHKQGDVMRLSSIPEQCLVATSSSRLLTWLESMQAGIDTAAPDETATATRSLEATELVNDLDLHQHANDKRFECLGPFPANASKRPLPDGACSPFKTSRTDRGDESLLGSGSLPAATGISEDILPSKVAPFIRLGKDMCSRLEGLRAVIQKEAAPSMETLELHMQKELTQSKLELGDRPLDSAPEHCVVAFSSSRLVSW
eukprot:gnl/TRDRNA2_/TRDRNA2_163304_c0_seq1.p1 gnl/TRDRNA2_/TRDRNA2_163304_c0~~gnl/TRDRNA2_/TRDRNA2_163304_c0_seq1.p1  ORF type:complete len:397 (-),score=46.55 gnl/TRDRNA2_/TRDRNA2_163304_c0_seq1:17-1207(-)